MAQKQWTSVAMAAMVMMGGVGKVGAVATSGPIQVSATVAPIESLNCSILRCTNATCSTSVPNQPNMSFGTMVNSDPANPNSALMGTDFFRAFCGVNTSNRPYTITQTGTALTCTTGGCAGTGATIPDNAWVFAPGATVDTTDADTLANETPPAGTSIGAKTSAHSTNVSWINTGTNTNIVVVFADYAIAAPPNTVNAGAPVVAPGQAAGTYTGTVTWSLTASP